MATATVVGDYAQMHNLKEGMNAALDSLHGIARVVPVETTAKMIASVDDIAIPDAACIAIYAAMSASGDLTNPPEVKP